ncbi:MAG: hypothetical protein KC636_19350, partial [Myxococcales bacterium]|nr:hypothetical protein [Myxococcales bacterium]
TTETTETTGGVDVPCGEELVCDGVSEYCSVVHPGVPDSPIEYSCPSIPGECVQDLTCACLEEQGVFGECEELPDGGLRVMVFLP